MIRSCSDPYPANRAFAYLNLGHGPAQSVRCARLKLLTAHTEREILPVAIVRDSGLDTIAKRALANVRHGDWRPMVDRL
jgi:hypothetical protein